MVKDNSLSINAFNNNQTAKDYNEKKGFDPLRKEVMLKVALSALKDLTPQGGSLLELGAGTGIFSKLLLNDNYFNEILVTDGSEAMLEIARELISSTKSRINFKSLTLLAFLGLLRMGIKNLMQSLVQWHFTSLRINGNYFGS
ncbi:class I SAM-dependent methyltransferase [Anaerobacillus sp. CMMVII]|uniref:class I SAM-dependent methyltransferase n=1 Tax=Anaerobacillus sp. CMMVII TaxID=2755588 RepID=UPI0021B7A04C|nr:class I SAM-dependent methyltransferase [Anaerobacillus sp. CMMVII]MCT8140503.1 class I SAM-dependent methyltransferase [Anaerobacillus sp. CMMVII]